MIKAINNVSNTSFKGSEVKKEKAQKTPEQIKDGKKKLAIGLAAAATVAIAGIAIASKVKSGKPVDLSAIKFDKGIAKKGDKLFTGTVSDTLTGGDKITMTYKNGKIMQSVREGSKNVTKKFEYASTNYGNSTEITSFDLKGKVINKTKLEFSKDGKLNSKTFSDGTEKGWHKNGQLKYEEFPNGTAKRWFENGQLKYEEFPDGTRKWWYKNGQLKYKDFPDGTRKYFDINGQEIK